MADEVEDSASSETSDLDDDEGDDGNAGVKPLLSSHSNIPVGSSNAGVKPLERPTTADSGFVSDSQSKSHPKIETDDREWFEFDGFRYYQDKPTLKIVSQKITCAFVKCLVGKDGLVWRASMDDNPKKFFVQSGSFKDWLNGLTRYSEGFTSEVIIGKTVYV